jgi:Zinc finger, C3HC4 type (RING finger)
MTDPDSSSSEEENELTFSPPDQSSSRSEEAAAMDQEQESINSKKKKKKKKDKKKKDKKKKKKGKKKKQRSNDGDDDDDDKPDEGEDDLSNDDKGEGEAEESTLPIVGSTAALDLPQNNTMNKSIPKKKRPAPEISTKSSSDRTDDDSDSDEEIPNDDMEVSLNDLKRQVMGRDLRTEDDSDLEHDTELRQVRALVNAGPAEEADEDGKPSASSTLLADKLRRDLICTICHDVIYPPISLLCGHSFCQPCIEWWFDTSKRDPSCPTCRKSVPIERHDAVAPNLALKSCIMAVYGSEIVKRIQERRPKGERGGEHDKGYEVMSHLVDETWHYVKTRKRNDSTSTGTVQVRRNIVLDAEDQRMQLALAISEKPEQIVDNQQSGFRIKVCLLSMEEDEAADSGFPTLVDNPEDEQLVCGRDSRFLHSFMSVQMKAENGRLSPLARIPSGDDGCFDYTLDPSTSAGDPSNARGLVFEHIDTGCQLEVDLAQLQSRGGSTLRPHAQPDRHTRNMGSDDDEHSSVDRPRGRNFVLGQSDDSEAEGADEFEEDGFLVQDNRDASDTEGEFSEGEEEDVCNICHEHGELMICDGGDDDDGCGKAFHAACVNRLQIPKGDWICQDCAASFGISTGPEGHEFKTKVQANSSDGSGKRKVINDDSDSNAPEEGTKGEENEDDEKPTTKKRRMVLSDDSDSD